MKAATEYRVVEIERLGGGVLIAFSNGEAAHYPAELLYSIISQAAKLQPVRSGRSSPSRAHMEEQ
jgi:hypothetical protein